MGYRAPRPRDLVTDAIARASAARTALRELDGELPDQPLAVTIDRATRRGDAAERARRRRVRDRRHVPGRAARRSDARDAARRGARRRRAAAVVRRDAVRVRLDRRRAARDRAPRPSPRVDRARRPVARPRSRRRARGGLDVPPDRRRLRPRADRGADRASSSASEPVDERPHARVRSRRSSGAVPLAIAWRELPCPTPRVIPLAYELGCILHRHAGRRDARFSPTIQIPVARGRQGRSDAPPPPRRLGDDQRALRRRRARAVRRRSRLACAR